MFKRLLIFSLLVAFISTVMVLWIDGLGMTFFRESRWLFIGAVVVGTVSGIIGAVIKRKSTSSGPGKTTIRHTIDSTMEHWGTAVGISILIISGFQIRFYKSFAATNLHYLGLFLTLLFGTYFLADFFVSKKGETILPDTQDIIDGTIKKYLFHVKIKETGKYLASQKASFLLFVVLGGQIFISGVIKLLVFYVHISSSVLETATLVHDISAVLFGLVLIIHVFLVLTSRKNLVLLRSWFTGRTPEVVQTETAESGNVEKEDIKNVTAETLPAEKIELAVPKIVSEKVTAPVQAQPEVTDIITPEIVDGINTNPVLLPEKVKPVASEIVEGKEDAAAHSQPEDVEKTNPPNPAAG